VSVYVIGIDPGKKGSITALDKRGAFAGSVRFDRDTPLDVVGWLRSLQAGGGIVFASMEKVGAMPGNGGTSMFKFGVSTGWCHGILDALGIPWELVTPTKWQRGMACLNGGNKNITKAAAQRLWPDERPSPRGITQDDADGMLIAEYARRLAVERGLV